MKPKTLYCQCIAGKKCDHLLIYDFGDKQIAVDMKKGKKLLGGVVVNLKDLKKALSNLSA